MGIYHSHPDELLDSRKNDFSYFDYEVIFPDEVNFLGMETGVRKLKKVQGKDKKHPLNDLIKPETTKVRDGIEIPYEPRDNGLRASMGLPYLNNGTIDPEQNLR